MERITSSAECIASGELPHARHKLEKTASEDRHSNNDVGGVNTPGIHIVHGEDECSWSEGKKATEVEQVLVNR